MHDECYNVGRSMDAPSFWKGFEPELLFLVSFIFVYIISKTYLTLIDIDVIYLLINTNI